VHFNHDNVLCVGLLYNNGLHCFTYKAYEMLGLIFFLNLPISMNCKLILYTDAKLFEFTAIL